MYIRKVLRRDTQNSSSIYGKAWVPACMGYAKVLAYIYIGKICVGVCKPSPYIQEKFCVWVHKTSARPIVSIQDFECVSVCV